uniref:Uncharacterized protein n=1 Tax=Ditylenchus dipsaci TaxID=166011 RepID=A0A915CLL4_9BILA
MNGLSKQKDEVEEQEEEPQEEVPLDARDALNEIGRLTRRMGGEEDEDMDMRSMYTGAPQPQNSSQNNAYMDREQDYGQLPVPAATITDASTAIDELFRLSQQMSNE